MQRITWFKDIVGDVYIWAKEVVPFPSTLDTADFCIQNQDSTVALFVPEAVQSESFDWGFNDLPFELKFVAETVGAQKVGAAV